MRAGSEPSPKLAPRDEQNQRNLFNFHDQRYGDTHAYPNAWQATWWLRQAGAVLCFFLVCIVPGRADVEILRLRIPLFVEVTKITVPRQIESPVGKTSLYDYELFVFGKILVDKTVCSFGVEVVSQKADRRIDNTPPSHSLVTLHVFIKLRILVLTDQLASSAGVHKYGSTE
jgi:hypothetical protein